MDFHRLRTSIGALLLLNVTIAYGAAPMLTITPSTLSLTTRSDGSTSVIYTVTNNLAHTSVNHLIVNPAYHSTAAIGSLSLQNDTCSGATLAPSASCQFGVVIVGANQANSFAITPSVCNDNQQICSTSTSSNTLTVNVDQISQDPYAYFGIFQNINQHLLGINPSATQILPINALTNAFGTPVSGLNLPDNAQRSAIAVSLDGTRVYAAEKPNQGSPADIAVLSSGATMSLLQRIILPAITEDVDFFMVVSPDGNTLYVSVTDFGSTNKVYSINLSTDGVTELTGDFDGPISLALSPDGSRLFVANYHQSDEGGFVSVMDTATNALVATLTGGVANPNGVLVSPDGATLYISNVGTPSIVKYAISLNGNYLLTNSINSADNSAMSISSDGNDLYVSTIYSRDISQINTQTLTSVRLVTQDEGIANAGIALTPNNNALFTAGQSASFFTAQWQVGSNPIPYPGVWTNLMTEPVFTLLTSMPNISNMNQYGAFVN